VAGKTVKLKVQGGKDHSGQEARDLLLLKEIEADIDTVSPQFLQITKAIRSFAGRYLSSETPHRAVLGVVSPRPGEGRTTIALGLAGALAEIYSRVVLVEMETDEIAPTLCAEMKLGVEKGLRDYIEQDVSLDQVLRPTDKENLWFLPAGPVRHQASRLDATARTRALLSQLRQDFDVVLVDLPPVLTSEEAPALLAALDSVVLVINAGSTTSDDVTRALTLCASVPVRGVLLNRVRLRAPRWLASLVRS
jgi:Mrp family chromosome partitioning ATPase